jgi:uncharacterized membrane protein YraQ (UPF0718 family)
MKGALVLFGGLAALLVVLVARADRWAALGTAIAAQGKTLAPLIALAVVIGACVEVLLTPAQIAGWLGDGAGFRGVLSGWVAGALTPGGGPIGLPLASALARRGAALPAVLTYLTSMSLLSFIRLPMEWGLLGARVTLIRWGATLLLPPLVGVCALLWQRWSG